MEDYYLLINNNFSNNQAYLNQLNETIFFECVSNNDTFTYCRRNIIYFLYGFNQTSKAFKKIGQMTINSLNSDLNNLQQSVNFDVDQNEKFLTSCRTLTSRNLVIIFELSFKSILIKSCICILETFCSNLFCYIMFDTTIMLQFTVNK